MARTDNYLKQAAQAKAYFLTYDQEALIRKLNLAHDEDYLYPVFFSQTYRLSRKTGDLARQGKHGWEDANTHGEVMTLLDLICDSREDRFVSGKWKVTPFIRICWKSGILWQKPVRKDPKCFVGGARLWAASPCPRGISPIPSKSLTVCL